MKVKNIIIFNKEIFKEQLVRDLIKEDISYLQIEDEFHFNDKIYRIYDSNLDQEEISNLNENIQTVVIENAEDSLIGFEDKIDSNEKRSFSLKEEPIIKNDSFKRNEENSIFKTSKENIKAKQYVRQYQKVLSKNFNRKH